MNFEIFEPELIFYLHHAVLFKMIGMIFNKISEIFQIIHRCLNRRCLGNLPIELYNTNIYKKPIIVHIGTHRPIINLFPEIMNLSQEIINLCPDSRCFWLC